MHVRLKYSKDICNAVCAFIFCSIWYDCSIIVDAINRYWHSFLVFLTEQTCTQFVSQDQNLAKPPSTSFRRTAIPGEFKKSRGKSANLMNFYFNTNCQEFWAEKNPWTKFHLGYGQNICIGRRSSRVSSVSYPRVEYHCKDLCLCLWINSIDYW